MDAVLLTGIVRAERGERLLDLGTGTGIIPILLTAKTKCRHFTGLEIQRESAEMARRSVKLNRLEDMITIDEGDIKEAAGLYKPLAFDIITANPPYIPSGGGLVSLSQPKAIARHELLCTLEDCVKTASALLKPRGRFYMVHRPQRLADIFRTFNSFGLEPKYLRLVYPHINEPPNMVLLSAVKGGRTMLNTAPPLVVYDADGEYTSEVREIYYGVE
jgi:tRNA1Val (adenine37-N6)-methyltransferase